MEQKPDLKLIKIWICEACLRGEGEECHTPGCAFFLHPVGDPIAAELYEVVSTIPAPTAED